MHHYVCDTEDYRSSKIFQKIRSMRSRCEPGSLFTFPTSAWNKARHKVCYKCSFTYFTQDLVINSKLINYIPAIIHFFPTSFLPDEPNIRTDPFSVEVSLYGVAKFTCSFSSYPSPSITWKMMDTTILNQSRWTIFTTKQPIENSPLLNVS